MSVAASLLVSKPAPLDGGLRCGSWPLEKSLDCGCDNISIFTAHADL